MKQNETSLMPQMSTPVERKLFEAPALGDGAARVVASRSKEQICSESCGSSRGKCYNNCLLRHFGSGAGSSSRRRG